MRLILASASPARLAVLRAAGVSPEVIVSEVDEDAIAARLGAAAPEQVVLELARAKARAVAAAVSAGVSGSTSAVLIGCDSMLSIGTELVGKPHTPEVAAARWRSMRGSSGQLLTGHCVIRIDPGGAVREASGTGDTTLRFANPSDDDIDAYVATGEPLAVAGAFTLDGIGGWFIDSIDGDPSSVIGISLPLTRRLLRDVGVDVASLWRPQPPQQ